MYLQVYLHNVKVRHLEASLTGLARLLFKQAN
jgi:hypothetical protein